MRPRFSRPTTPRTTLRPSGAHRWRTRHHCSKRNGTHGLHSRVNTARSACSETTRPCTYGGARSEERRGCAGRAASRTVIVAIPRSTPTARAPSTSRCRVIAPPRSPACRGAGSMGEAVEEPSTPSTPFAGPALRVEVLSVSATPDETAAWKRVHHASVTGACARVPSRRCSLHTCARRLATATSRCARPRRRAAVR